MSIRVMHVFPNSVRHPQHVYLGSTKDIRGRTEYFQKRRIDYYELPYEPPRTTVDCRLIRSLSRRNLQEFTHVILEYPLFSKSLQYIREQNPAIKVFIRAHNAEFFHYWHYAHASVRYMPGRKAVEFMTGSFSRLKLDYQCGHSADSILSISDWESRHYWNYLAPARSVTTLPYFLPEFYEHTIPPATEKRPSCVCLMSTTEGTLPFLRNAVANFIAAVTRLGNAEREWSFLVTGDNEKINMRLPDRMQYTGFLENPFTVLSQSRAIALLSDYGFGFKTKILEAILCKNYVFVTRKLFARIPTILHPFCCVVDPQKPDTFRQALTMTEHPFPTVNPNDLLRQEAFAVLDRLFTKEMQ